MEVIPALDLRGGRCVRLEQGDFDRETLFSEDPLAMARHWEALGAPRLHVVDLDGAAAGEPQQTPLVASIIRAVTIPVQVGGGLRTAEAVHRLLRLGADRAILGTAAVHDPDLVRGLCAEDPARIVVALDAREDRVAIQGWQEGTDLPVLDLLQRMYQVGARRFLYTDIARDGLLQGPDFETVALLYRGSEAAIIASGGIAALGHIRRLAALGIEGCIVGRALYVGAFTLPDALAVAAGEVVAE